METLDRMYNIGQGNLFRMGPRRVNQNYFELLPEDNDVFLTQEEDRFLFSHRFRLNPQTFSQERIRFLAKVFNHNFQTNLCLFFTYYLPF